MPLVRTAQLPAQEAHYWLEIWAYLDQVAPQCVYLYAKTADVYQWDLGPTWTEPARMLHEIMHVVCTPPGESIKDRGEIWLLLPYERALYQELFEGEPDLLAACDKFQSGTRVDGEIVMDVERHPKWLAGVERARRLGLLDDDGRVTWRRANWSRLREPIDASLPDV